MRPADQSNDDVPTSSTADVPRPDADDAADVPAGPADAAPTEEPQDAPADDASTEEPQDAATDDPASAEPGNGPADDAPTQVPDGPADVPGDLSDRPGDNAATDVSGELPEDGPADHDTDDDKDDDTEFAAAIERTAAALRADDEFQAHRRRWAVQVGAGAVALALSVLLVVYLATSGGSASDAVGQADDAASSAPAAPPPALENWVPPATSSPRAGQPRRPSDAFAGWAGQLSELGIPLVALQAYGYTEAVLHQTQPNCRLSWTLLAGIGEVESDHGRYGGAQLKPDGTSEPRIVGVPLDGTSTKLIPDTDNGLLDGDRTFDRAVGAMQFIPSTWNRWAVDGDGNGKADPYDLDDAALAAGYYLCANGRDLSTGGGWWNAVLSYNNVTPYADKVFAAADRYGRASRTGG